TFAPEIFLLEGRHEDYTQTPSASPSLSCASYLFGNRTQLTPSRLSNRHHSQSPLKPLIRPGLDNDWSTNHNGNHSTNNHQPHSRHQHRRSWTKHTQTGGSGKLIENMINSPKLIQMFLFLDADDVSP
ncbi:unnamed protein product, partial [Didymodactylos carnosus]